MIDNKGYIATNYHVFAECERLEIKHNDKIIKETKMVVPEIHTGKWFLSFVKGIN